MDIRFRLATRSYSEDSICIWINTNSDDKCKSQFEKLFPTMKIFETCDQFIDSIDDETIFLILSGLINKESIEKICNLPEVYSIYIFNSINTNAELLIKQSKKFKGTFTKLETIRDHINQDGLQYEDVNGEFDCTSSHPDLRSMNEMMNKQEPSFMYAQLVKEVIINVNYSEDDKNEMMDYLRKKYLNHQSKMKQINQFQIENQSDSILWYTKDAIFYRLINKALRIQNIDKLYAMRVFIKNLHQQIVQLHQNTQQTDELTLYRGQMMSRKQFEQMKNHSGGLLAFHSFLSTTKNKALASIFTESTSERMVGVLFEITIDPPFHSNVPYTDITEFSNFGCAEQEYLFTMGSVFRIGTIHTNHTSPYCVQLSLTSENDQQLTNLTKCMRHACINSPPFLSDLAAVVFKKGNPLKAQQICEKILSLKTTPNEQAVIYVRLGLYTRVLGDLSKSLYYYEQSLKKYQVCGIKDGSAIGKIQNNIGLIFKEQKDFQSAHSYYENALSNVNTELVPDQELIAMIENNIGCVHCHQNNFSQALKYYEKSLEHRLQCLTFTHPDIAQSFNNIGTVFFKQDEKETALFFYILSLKIKRESMCRKNVSFATTLSNISEIYIQQNKTRKAGKCLKEAIRIVEQSLGSDHETALYYRTRLNDIIN